MKTWFKTLLNSTENDDTINSIKIEGEYLILPPESLKYKIGKLEILSLQELNNKVNNQNNTPNKISETVADVQSVYQNTENANALFQVASQFNLLEMANPTLTPAHGVTIYEDDYTQGPKSAIACGAATIYRNYFAQSTNNQINCMSLIEKLLNNEKNKYWTMKNGYVLFTNRDKIHELNEHINSIGRETIKQHLQVGIQWNPQVTIGNSTHTVNQIFCSAIPVSYNSNQSEYDDIDLIYEPFSSLILEATYEATLCTSIINDSNISFLTMVGGGAFGNAHEWIINAIEHAVHKYQNRGLDIRINSYMNNNPSIQHLLN